MINKHILMSLPSLALWDSSHLAEVAPCDCTAPQLSAPLPADATLLIAQYLCKDRMGSPKQTCEPPLSLWTSARSSTGESREFYSEPPFLPTFTAFGKMDNNVSLGRERIIRFFSSLLVFCFFFRNLIHSENSNGVKGVTVQRWLRASLPC